MLHPDASGMKHGTRETHENYLGFVSDPRSETIFILTFLRILEYGRRIQAP